MIQEFLLAREQRVLHQEELLAKYNKTLVTLKINYPDFEKAGYINNNIINIIAQEILAYYKKYIIIHEKYESLEGLIYHFIFDMNFKATKKAMINIEEQHILGRCVDIDVYDVNKTSISRTELGFQPRKCFICDNMAHICSRAKTHTLNQISQYFQKIYTNYLNSEMAIQSLCEQLSSKATMAMICEVSVYPSFGLVSPLSNGAHEDMDFYLFLDSTMAIAPYLKQMAKAGYTYHLEEQIFDAIREIGKECEEVMFKATKGINTHKGMIFLMGICITAVSKNLYEQKDWDNIQVIIKSMVKDILNDFKDIAHKENLTHGEKLFLQYGFTGIRGQVTDGLQDVFNIVEIYKNINLSPREQHIQMLIELMAIIEDSTVVHRHGIDALRQVQNDAKNLLKIGGITTKEGQGKIKSLEDDYITRKISSGGCADLLAVAIFLISIKNQNSYKLE